MPGVAAPAAAAGVGGATWTPETGRVTAVTSGYRVPRDSTYLYLRLRWNAAGLTGLRGYGLAYTQEVNDLSGRLSASGFWMSDLPGAAYDRDDDEADGRWEEAEVTAPDPRLLVAGRTYTVAIQLTRWWRPCASGCRWRWEFRPARVAALSQLSARLFGEWQAIRYTLPWATARLPALPRPAASPAPGTFAAVAAMDAGATEQHRFIGRTAAGHRAVCAGPAPSLAAARRTCRALGLRDPVRARAASRHPPTVAARREHRWTRGALMLPAPR